MDFNQANAQSDEIRERQELFSPTLKLLLHPGSAAFPLFLSPRDCFLHTFIGLIPSAPTAVTSCLLLMKPFVFSLLIACCQHRGLRAIALFLYAECRKQLVKE